MFASVALLLVAVVYVSIGGHDLRFVKVKEGEDCAKNIRRKEISRRAIKRNVFSTRARSSSDVGERVILLGSGESGLGAGASKNSLLVHFLSVSATNGGACTSV